MLRLIVGLLATALVATSASAMDVATFLTKAEALMKKGPMAVFSSDIGLLKAEMKTGFTQLRSEQVAARKAGRKPASCMPAKVGVSPNELLGHLRSIPASQRGMPMKEALGSWMQKKYPCPTS